MSIYSRYYPQALAMAAMAGMIKGMPESIKIVHNASTRALINEYKLILKKESELSSKQREMVKNKIASLLRKGKISEEELKGE